MKASYSKGRKKKGQCQFILLIEIFEESLEDKLSRMLADSLAEEIDREIMSELLELGLGNRNNTNHDEQS